MKLTEILGKIDNELSAILKKNILRHIRTSLDRIICVGVPSLDRYVDGNIVFNDANYIAITPFIILEPLDFDPSVTDIFSLSVNTFKPVDNVNSLAIFATGNSTFKLDITNQIDESLLEQIMNTFAKIGLSSQTYGFANLLSSFLGKIGDMDIPGVSLLANALSGRLFSGPKIWVGGSIDTSIDIVAKHDFLTEGYDPNRIMEVFDTIKLFTSPRGSGYSTSSKTTTQSLSTQGSDDLNVKLAKLQYKYPFFCKVVSGNTGEIIYPVAMVTQFSSDFNILNVETLTARQIPQYSQFSFTIQPVIPFRSFSVDSNSVSNDQNAPVVAIEKLLKSLIKHDLTENTSTNRVISNKLSRYKKINYGNIIKNV